MTTIIQHAASFEPSLPPGSFPALVSSLQAGLEWIEIDIIPLKNGDFALLHDPQLEHVSNGTGKVYQKSAVEIQELFYLSGDPQNENCHLGTLQQAVDLMVMSGYKSKIQLDLKPYAPLNESVLKTLLTLIEPKKEQFMVSCVADWALRILRRLDATIELGFDPLLYLDLVASEPRPQGVPPMRVGAFGYLDEHPLSNERWGSLGEYFAARAEALLQQVPAGSIWFINAALLDDALSADFDWIQFLHRNGSLVDAWTLDGDRLPLAKKLAEGGIDFLTSNQIAIVHNAIYGD